MRAAWCAIAIAAACGCGRVGFASHSEDAGMIDAAVDAAIDPIGCSDGERDGYADLAMYPTIAACAATWTGEQDLRAPPTGIACGDEGATCNVPADACSAGWHVCAASGDVGELLVLSASDCATLAGRFVAASGHCESDAPEGNCVYAAPGAFPCLAGEAVTCTQPICCGATCDATNDCKDGVWPGATQDDVDLGQGCGNTPSANQDGVLCCKD